MPAASREEALIDLGRMAKDRREESRMSLEEIYERTRIRLEYLKGIEQGSYKGFPDLVYIRGFIRTYLSVIGAEDLKDDFISWLGKENTRQDVMPPTNLLGNGAPTKGFKPASHFWLFLILFLILAGSGGYVWYSWTNLMPGSRNKPATPAEAAKTDESQKTPPSENIFAGITSKDSSPDGSPNNSSDAKLAASTDNTLLSILPASASVTSQSQTQASPPKPYLLIQAKGDVWMEVSIGDKVVFSKTLQSNSEVSWDLIAPAKVRYGRPHMADVTLNGKALGLANPKAKKSETYFYNPDGTTRKVQ
ncbi:XRE family transcriptional regulator [Synergistales bacterium]|nr:XRE family transcriptional regulator [Synergistales bacterium]